ncbi:MAG: threonine synthase [Bacilli bacterium]|jgi:threonine synthase
MGKFIGYRCTICGKEFYGEKEMFTCPYCGEEGILDVLYDYDEIKKIVTRDYFKNNKNYSMFRYAPIMSIPEEHIHEMLRIGWTPLYRSKRLKEHLGLKELYIKDEGLNPSASSKDRASGVAVLRAIEAHKEAVACSSTGNAASSLACQAAHMGLKAFIFVPKRAPIGKLTQISMYGATLICVDGDYKAAHNLSAQAIEKYHWYNRNCAINPHLMEGKKTVSFEIAEQLDFKVTDWVAVSVGDGCTIGGVYKGFYEFYKLGLIDRIPKILGVQSTGCAPFCIASEMGTPLREAEENTIADSIAVGIPRNPVKAMNAIKMSRGAWISVTDESIIKKMALLGRLEGIFGEPAGVAALAGVEKAIEEGMIKKSETVTFIMTGNGLKDPVSAQRAISPPKLMKPDIKELDNYLKEKGVI